MENRSTFKSKRPEVFGKKGVINNLLKLTRKDLRQSNKIAGLGTATLLKKTLTQIFSFEF